MTEPAGCNDFERLIRENVPLVSLTTIGIGGPAKYFAEASTAEALSAGLLWSRERKIPVFILGGGSNIIVSDNGFPGLVLHNRIRGVGASVVAGEVLVTAGAGEDWDTLVATTVVNNWAGLECLSGIPGLVGATPIQNVGAYGQEVSETLAWVTAVDSQTNQPVRFLTDECEFGYRTSRFKTRDRDRYIITSVTFRLVGQGKPTVRYMELQLRLTGAHISSPTLADVREAVIEIRHSKGMVLDLADPDSRSVGSFFVNPVVTAAEFENVKSLAGRRGLNAESVPGFPSERGKIKLSAAWLIEHSGFERGYVYGNIGLSKKHTLAIINRGGGTAKEVVELAGRIKFRVQNTFGVKLTPEPVFIGFDAIA